MQSENRIRICVLMVTLFIMTVNASAFSLAQQDPQITYLYSIPLPSLVGPPYEIAWSSDMGKLAISGIGIYVYDFNNQSFVQMSESSSLNGPIPLAWSPDGSQLVGGGIRVLLWDVNTGEIIHEIGEQYRYRIYTDVAWSPHGQNVVAASIGLEQTDWSIWLWDASTAELLLHILDEDAVETSPYGDRGFGQVEFIWPEDLMLTTSWGDNRVRGWAISTGSLALTFNMEDEIKTIAVNQESRQLAIVVLPANVISIWDMISEEVVDTIRSERIIEAIAWNAEDSILAILDSMGLYIWTSQDGLSLVREVSSPRDVVWSADNNYIAVLTTEDIQVFEVD